MTKEEILKCLDNILIKIHNNKKHNIKPVIYINQQEHQAISEIRDRMIPVKPDDVFEDFDSSLNSLYLGWCPKCNYPTDSRQKHCPQCLQTLDWSEWE